MLQSMGSQRVRRDLETEQQNDNSTSGGGEEGMEASGGWEQKLRDK